MSRLHALDHLGHQLHIMCSSGKSSSTSSTERPRVNKGAEAALLSTVGQAQGPHSPGGTTPGPWSRD